MKRLRNISITFSVAKHLVQSIIAALVMPVPNGRDIIGAIIILLINKAGDNMVGL